MIEKQQPGSDETRTFLDLTESRSMREANGKRQAEKRILDESIRIVSRIVYRSPPISAFLLPLALLWSRLWNWLAYLPIRMGSFLSAILGPRVSEEIHADRMETCLACDNASVVLTRKPPYSKMYCTSCRCPKWPLAELGYKNRLRNWGCPIGKFPGRPNPPEWKAIIEKDQGRELERVKELKKKHDHKLPVVGGCVSRGI